MGKYWKLFSVLVGLLLLLSACEGSSTSSSGQGNKNKPAAQKESIENFPMTVKNVGKPVEAVLTYGLVSGTPFEGTLNAAFYTGAPESEILQFFDESLFHTNGDYEITNDGAAAFELSSDKKMMTIKIKDNVKWHDGESVKAEDLEYAYL